jgi:hypothetical protein
MLGIAPVFSVLSKKSIYIVKIGEISFGIFFDNLGLVRVLLLLNGLNSIVVWQHPYMLWLYRTFWGI